MAGNKPFNKPQTETRERDPQLAGLKVPPHSIEAEQSVLGGLMLDNERWDDVAERVVAEDFYTRPHRHIFTEMARLQESGSPIDLITLAESLERLGQLDSCGGFAYLAELSKNTPSAANISAYADIVRERAVVREMISVAKEIAEAVRTEVVNDEAFEDLCAGSVDALGKGWPDAVTPAPMGANISAPALTVATAS